MPDLGKTLMLLLFEALAICTIGIMTTSGVGSGLAMATAIFQLILGVVIARAMYRNAQHA